jgi:phosphoglycolate phosphatase
MLPPNAVVFDLDGTLIDSRGDIVAAVNHALVRTGRDALPAQVIVRYVGDGARALCARAANLDEWDERVDELRELFVAYYLEHPIDFTRWMPDAQEALDSFAQMGVAIGLCTNKARSVTDAILAALGVRTRFRAISAGGDVPEPKPAPGPLLHVAQQLGLPPSVIVMVGDGAQDIEAARRAKMRVIAVEHGFVARERLIAARPDVLIGKLAELPDIIRRWRDATVRMPMPPRR